MSALHGFWDWTLFAVAVGALLYAVLLLLNLLVILAKGMVSMSMGHLLTKILFIVSAGVFGFWVLTRVLEVL